MCYKIESVRLWNFFDDGSYIKDQHDQSKFFCEYHECWLVKKCQNYTSKVDSTEFLISLFKNINFGDHFMLKHFFNSIFEPLYFLKLCPIFDNSTISEFKNRVIMYVDF